jgi:hypothetical protein
MSAIQGSELSDGRSQDLLKQLSDQTAVPGRQELDLAKAKLAVKGEQVGLRAGMFGGDVRPLRRRCTDRSLGSGARHGADSVARGAGCRSDLWRDRRGSGARRQEQGSTGRTPVPEQTVASVKEDVEWTRQRANDCR